MFESGVHMKTKYCLLITLWTSVMIFRVSTRAVPNGFTGSPTSDTYPPTNTGDTYPRFKQRSGPIALRTGNGYAASTMMVKKVKPRYGEDNNKEVILSNSVLGNSASKDEIMRTNNVLTNNIVSNNGPSVPSNNVLTNNIVSNNGPSVPSNNVLTNNIVSNNGPSVPSNNVLTNNIVSNNGPSVPSNNVLRNNIVSNNGPSVPSNNVLTNNIVSNNGPSVPSNNVLTNNIVSNNGPNVPSNNVLSNNDDQRSNITSNNFINNIKPSYNYPDNKVNSDAFTGNDIPNNNGLSSNFPSNNVLSNSFPSNNLSDNSELDNVNVDGNEEVAVSNDNTPNHEEYEDVISNGLLQGLNSHGVENMMEYIFSDLESSRGEYRTEHVSLESSTNENGEENMEPDFDEDENITEKIQRNTEQETTPVYDGVSATDNDTINGLINIIEQMIGNGSEEMGDGKVITGVTTQVFVYPGGHIEREGHPYERKVIQDRSGSSVQREMTQSSPDDSDSTEDDEQLPGYSSLQEILDLSQNDNNRAIEDVEAAEDIVSEVESLARPILHIIQDVIINNNMDVSSITEGNSGDQTNIVEEIEENGNESANSPIHIVKEIEIVYSL
ncbi:putative uncharacterized protein DDB_G0277255 [Argopecten irradians]|uniref:putative uncharacterized protein DDB_G0277255 n=1 Tax=Argopecten irradians TaxID=31199 RepID=UPI00371A8DC4